MNFGDRLDAALERVGHPTLLGIDPHLDLLPEPFAHARDPEVPRADRAKALEDFGCALVDLAAGRVAAVKPQSAFFELLGADGVRAWENVVAHAHANELLVIGDVKRSDIASTAAAYATAFLEGLPGTDRTSLCDAVTLNPYLGSESIDPFLEVCQRTGTGAFILVRTSNPGSAEFQHHGTTPLAHVVAQAVSQWGDGLVGERGMSSIGAVVGATHAEELRTLRELLPRTPLLLPGYGAQGATAADVRAAFPDRERPWRGGLINSSRGIAFAWRKPEYADLSWKDAADRALEAMIQDLREALELPVA